MYKQKNDAIQPYGPIPSLRQLQWHETEFYSFIHFSINTFTDKEWGYGDEPAQRFNPSDFDADQIVTTIKAAGMKGLILTCKHHDGFCLWPSAYTEHSVKNSPWKNGSGDVVRLISEACHKHQIKFGVYLSPWDRNHSEYGKPAYVTYFKNQLTELLTQYGDIFCLWLDGANGGDGYYGGKSEVRAVDRLTYYGWTEIFELAHELQKNLVIFSDIGPDVRWIGNEAGWAGNPCWSRYTPKGIDGNPPAPGAVLSKEGIHGHRDGEFWIPAEVDVSIRPGWFYHAFEDSAVRTAENLIEIYYESIGRGCGLNLNIPPDRRGQIHQSDIDALRKFQSILDATFSQNLAANATIKADETCEDDRNHFEVNNLVDGNAHTYWTAGPNVKHPEITLQFPEKTEFNVISLREYLPLGQRVHGWAIDIWLDEKWVKFAEGESIGNRHLWRGTLLNSHKIRLRITDAPVCPVLSEFGVHKEPVVLKAPSIHRDSDDNIVINGNGTIHYTLDGTSPGTDSPVYRSPFEYNLSGCISALVADHGQTSEITCKQIGYPKKKWTLCAASSENPESPARNVLDASENSIWASMPYLQREPQWIEINMQENLKLKGFSYIPRQGENSACGLITHFLCEVSEDHENWTTAAQGEFSNIENNPIEQMVYFDKPESARYIRFTGLKVVEGDLVIVAGLNVFV